MAIHFVPIRRGAPPDPDDRYRLSVPGGLAALSLDAMASVAYGPEAIVLVLALAGGAGLGLTLPVTAAIAALLLVVTVSYRQVIAAFPDGGGSYSVAKAHLGRRASRVAGASLIIDYVLNVAVSIAAGVAATVSAFPGLLPYRLELCLAALAAITALNLRGIALSARAFIVPTVVFVVSILTVITVGLLRGEPAQVPALASAPADLQALGALLLLKAFANGCASLTGIEAIANAVPNFRKPRVRRAQRAELALGVLLAVMLLGIAVLIEKFEVTPVEGTTVLAQVTAGALGNGIPYYLVLMAAGVLLVIAANTSFGGLPVLAQLLASDNNLPHLFALRADRQVHRYGIGFLAVTSAALLVAAQGRMNTLVPLFAIGVFVGFTLAQAGMVVHWRSTRPAGWRAKATLNGTGAVLTGLAAVVVTVSKFSAGGWLIAAALPLLVLTMERTNRAYARIGERLELGQVPPAPHGRRSLVLVPVHGVNRLTAEALSAAMSLGDRVVALNVTWPGEQDRARAFVRDWERWHPEVELTQVYDERRRLDVPVLQYLATVAEEQVFVLIAEVEPAHVWQRVLQNQRGAILARALRRHSRAVVSRMRFRVLPAAPLPGRAGAPDRVDPGPARRGRRPRDRARTRFPGVSTEQWRALVDDVDPAAQCAHCPGCAPPGAAGSSTSPRWVAGWSSRPVGTTTPASTRSRPSPTRCASRSRRSGSR